MNERWGVYMRFGVRSAKQGGRATNTTLGTTAYRGWIPRHGVYRGISRAQYFFGLGYWVCSPPATICAFGWAQSRPGTMGSFRAKDS